MSGEICFTVDMKTNASSSPGNQLWGIYFTDREYAREMGDPLRTVIEAPTKLAAEEQAARLGFSDPWAHPVTPEQAQNAKWISVRHTGTGQVITKPAKRSIHV
jgi:hypothetical protein